ANSGSRSPSIRRSQGRIAWAYWRVRLEIQSTRFETGRVHLPFSALWLTTYEAELLAFPQGRFDDQVDASSQALNYLSALLARRGPLYRRDIRRRDVERR